MFRWIHKKINQDVENAYAEGYRAGSTRDRSLETLLERWKSWYESTRTEYHPMDKDVLKSIYKSTHDTLNDKSHNERRF